MQTRYEQEGRDRPDDSEDEQDNFLNSRNENLGKRNNRVFEYMNRKKDMEKPNKNMWLSRNTKFGLEIEGDNLKFVRMFYSVLTCQILLTGLFMVLPNFITKTRNTMSFQMNKDVENSTMKSYQNELTQNFPEAYSQFLLVVFQVTLIILWNKKIAGKKVVGLSLYLVNAASLAYLQKIKIFNVVALKDAFVLVTLFSSHFVGSTAFSFVIKRDWNSKEAYLWGNLTVFIVALQMCLVFGRVYCYHIISMVLIDLVMGYYVCKYTEKFITEKISKKESLDNDLVNHLAKIK